MPAQPVLCRVKQGRRRFVIFFNFKEAKEAGALAVEFIVSAVEDRQYAAGWRDGFDICQRKKG